MFLLNIEDLGVSSYSSLMSCESSRFPRIKQRLVKLFVKPEATKGKRTTSNWNVRQPKGEREAREKVGPFDAVVNDIERDEEVMPHQNRPMI